MDCAGRAGAATALSDGLWCLVVNPRQSGVALRLPPQSKMTPPQSVCVIAHVKSGRALIRKEQAGVLFKNLTIDELRLYYWESDGSEYQSSIYPFAVLEAKTEMQGDNSKVELFVRFANE